MKSYQYGIVKSTTEPNPCFSCKYYNLCGQEVYSFCRDHLAKDEFFIDAPKSKKETKAIIPEYAWKEERLYDIKEAIQAHIDEGMCIPDTYIPEYNKLITEVKNRKQ